MLQYLLMLSGDSSSPSSRGSSSSVLRSPQMRKELLRSVLARAESLTEDTVNDRTIQTLEECMEQTDNINSETSLDEKLNNQDEIVMDSRMMCVSSHVLKRCTKQLTETANSYNPAEFAQKIIYYLQQYGQNHGEERGLNWSPLAREIQKRSKILPEYSTLLGVLAPLEQKKIVRKKAVRESQAPVTRPENIKVVDKGEQDLEPIVKIREFIIRTFKEQRKPIDYFRVILHPTDYGKTIENTLHIAFLVRDGTVAITKDESGRLVIQPRSKEMAAQFKAAKGSKIQHFMSLDMGQWQKLVKAYKLQQPMLNIGGNE